MKAEENGNNPAYPDPLRGAEQSFVNQSPHEHPSGLTKREYFAAEAMKSFIINKGLSTWDACRNSEGLLTDVVDASVKAADELLKALES